MFTKQQSIESTPEINSSFNVVEAVGREIPIDMQFNDGHLISIVLYSILFVVGACGNITFFTTILRNKHKSRLSRIKLLLLNLAIADLLVTFLLMPLEIGWALTVSWNAGDKACRILSFFRIFGLYLSGFVLICISLDCYFAILKPLSTLTGNRRVKFMLCIAWIMAGICSLPQSFIFHVETHPDFPWYEQCVTFHSFQSIQIEMAYNIFGLVFMFGIPLVMISFSYGSILYEVYKVHEVKCDGIITTISNIKLMDRAKVRTLKLTIVVVMTFFLCWVPYNIMSLWYWIDKKSANLVDQKVQKGCFLFAVTNSCLNPFVYGYFHNCKNNKTMPIPVHLKPLPIRIFKYTPDNSISCKTLVFKKKNAYQLFLTETEIEQLKVMTSKIHFRSSLPIITSSTTLDRRTKSEPELSNGNKIFKLRNVELIY